MKFTKEQNDLYYVFTYAGDDFDTYTVPNKNSLVCSTKIDVIVNRNNLWGGKLIGTCKNKCCDFRCIKKKFYIQWL